MRKSYADEMGITHQQCSSCLHTLPLNQFGSQTARNGEWYYKAQCKKCFRDKARLKRQQRTSIKYREHIERAPLTAAAKLLQAKPDAIQILINHFPREYKDLYYAELRAADRYEMERKRIIASRPQNKDGRFSRAPRKAHGSGNRKEDGQRAG